MCDEFCACEACDDRRDPRLTVSNGPGTPSIVGRDNGIYYYLPVELEEVDRAALSRLANAMYKAGRQSTEDTPFRHNEA